MTIIIEFFIGLSKVIALVLFIAFLVYDFLEKFYHWFGYPTFFKKVEEKKMREIIHSIGINDKLSKRLNLALNYEHVTGLGTIPNYKDRCINLLKKCVTNSGSFSVGKKGPQLIQKAFLDVISYSLDQSISEEFAIYLRMKLREAAEQNTDLYSINRVVGLKKGSPAIAISFAREMNLPLCFHRGVGDYRFNQTEKNTSDLFDGDMPKSGDNVLIVDDSTTGGTMVSQAVDSLRELNCNIHYCLLIFEVLGKEGRNRLKEEKSIELISIAQYDGQKDMLTITS